MFVPSLTSYVELHVPDFDPAERFYAALGFAVAWRNDGSGHDGYLVMQKGGVALCFWPGNDSVTTQSYFGKFPSDTPRGYGVEVIVMVDDLDETYAAALRLGAVVDVLTMKPWGLRDFRVVDPFGYYLRFNDRHDPLIARPHP